MEWRETPQSGHGRIDQRRIEILPVEALSEHMRKQWPTIRSIACISRTREHIRAGQITRTQAETVYLITSLTRPKPKDILRLNRNHWRIETMHRDKDVTLGEDRYTNRSDNAPRNIFTLVSATRTLLKRISKSPTKAIEMMQDNRARAIRIVTDQPKNTFL
ncbi:ISAs1 family transposase [Ruegeria sp.]|uniref:ISAs1 family transposase n=1 Tax=Ruegeria sp. TaxID=1879320 RepID=UPI003B00B59C